jgi:hypothetical protein
VFNGKKFSISSLSWYILIYFVDCTLAMTSGSTGEKIKEKVTGTKDKVKETVGMGRGCKDKLRQPNEKGGRSWKGFRKGRRF